MKIETKFNLGQEVYVITPYRNDWGGTTKQINIVEKVEIEAIKKEIGYDCIYQRTNYKYITSVASGRCYSFNSRERGYPFPNFTDYIEIDNECEQVLFADLIQAGLVEKVEVQNVKD